MELPSDLPEYPRKFSDNLQNWMTLLPEELTNVAIINLAIPGSHDSMSYGIRRNSKVAPDAERIVKQLNRIIPCVIRRWAVTQSLTATDQLVNGIRYFDLRISLKKPENLFYFVHGLYCEKIDGPLNEIAQFLISHPYEFIILDFQHFYAFSNGDYAILSKDIIKIFGKQLYGPNDGKLNELTLMRARELKKRILVIFRNDISVAGQFWDSNSWPTPWPDTIKIQKLKEYLSSSLQYRSPDTGFVTQCILTPQMDFIVPRFYSTLRAKCAKKITKQLSDWIKEQKPGPFQNGDVPTSNVFIADFIDLDDYEFTKIVVDLNQKLLHY